MQTTMKTRDYAPGRRVDLFGTPAQPPVLMWHGRQTDARASVRTLAEELARRGLGVIVPDWDSHAADGGRSDLAASLSFARQHAEHPDALVLVGWSMGGLAAAGLTVNAAAFDVTIAHTVCLAGAFDFAEPFSGQRPSDLLDDTAVGTAFTLLHGTSDDVVPLQSSTAFAAELTRVGWPVELVELAADHGSIAGARYDAAQDRYLPANDDATREVVAQVADLVVHVGAR